jgi:hypothetical protein
VIVPFFCRTALLTILCGDLSCIPQRRSQFVQNRIVASPEIQPTDFASGDDQRSAQFMMGTLQIGHGR